jgi:hypothetical protein
MRLFDALIKTLPRSLLRQQSFKIQPTKFVMQ